MLDDFITSQDGTGMAAEAARAALDGHGLAVDALGFAVADRMQAGADDRL
jgi:hypothetical protein